MAPTKPPFHVLFIPGGIISRESQAEQAETSPAFTRDDYVTRRHEFWKKKASAPKISKGVTEYPVGSDVLTDGGDDQTMLRLLSTPLELALVGCCERLPRDECQFTPLRPQRSRLHRIVCPSNYDVDPEEVDENDGEDPQQDAVQETKSQPTSRKSGILRREKECHFLSLLCMHCTANALGHRALALAILQRTVDWESSVYKSSSGTSQQPPQPPHTLQHFLEAGGMKLLARWFVDSFTVGPASKGHVTSPTGSLLLPILQLLKCLPFEKNIVVASQIHKSIKRLKKAIDTLVDGLDPSQLKQKHPITGGLPVGIILSALDNLMSVWKQAAAADMNNKNDNDDQVKPHSSPMDTLQEELKRRFDTLVTLQNEGGQPPEWLPNSISSIISGKSHLLAMHANSFKGSMSNGAGGSRVSEASTQQTATIRGTNQNWYEHTKKEPTATWDKIVSRKRKEHGIYGRKSPTQFQKLHNTETSKKVSWADRPLIRSVTQAPLTEVRLFVKDDAQEFEEEMIPDHDSVGNSNIQSSNITVKEEAVDERELEDLCEDPDIEDMF